MKAVPRLSYAELVLEAVAELADRSKEGCSLHAIRKHILQRLDAGRQSTHTSSFNNLTMKAITRLISAAEIDAIPKGARKHSYRLSLQNKRRREQKLGGSSSSSSSGGALTASSSVHIPHNRPY